MPIGDVSLAGASLLVDNLDPQEGPKPEVGHGLLGVSLDYPYRAIAEPVDKRASAADGADVPCSALPARLERAAGGRADDLDDVADVLGDVGADDDRQIAYLAACGCVHSL